MSFLNNRIIRGFTSCVSAVRSCLCPGAWSVRARVGAQLLLTLHDAVAAPPARPHGQLSSPCRPCSREKRSHGCSADGDYFLLLLVRLLFVLKICLFISKGRVT